MVARKAGRNIRSVVPNGLPGNNPSISGPFPGAGFYMTCQATDCVAGRDYLLYGKTGGYR